MPDEAARAMASHPLDEPAVGDGNDTRHETSAHRRREREPRSAYYTGPPAKDSAFGTAPAGRVGKDRPREIVRIERDYSVSPSHIPQFYSSFPLELEGRISPTQFSDLINDINVILIEANNPKWAALDNGLAIVTLWISPWITGSHYHRKMKDFGALLARYNSDLLGPVGLQLRHPERNAWLFMEVEYY